MQEKRQLRLSLFRYITFTFSCLLVLFLVYLARSTEYCYRLIKDVEAMENCLWI